MGDARGMMQGAVGTQIQAPFDPTGSLRDASLGLAFSCWFDIRD